MSRFSISFNTKDDTELHLIKRNFERYLDDTNKEHFLKILDFYNLNRERIIDKRKIEQSVLEKINLRVVKGIEFEDYIVKNESYPKTINFKETLITIPEYIWFNIKEKAIDNLIINPIVTIIILEDEGELVLNSKNTIIIFGLDLININKGDGLKMAVKKERLSLNMYFNDVEAKESLKDKIVSRVNKESDTHGEVVKKLLNAGCIFRAHELDNEEFINRSALLIDVLRMKNDECIREVLENLEIVRDGLTPDERFKIKRFSEFLTLSRKYKEELPSEDKLHVIVDEIFDSVQAEYVLTGDHISTTRSKENQTTRSMLNRSMIPNGSGVSLYNDINIGDIKESILNLITKQPEIIVSHELGFKISVLFEIETGVKPSFISKILPRVKPSTYLSKSNIKISILSYVHP